MMSPKNPISRKSFKEHGRPSDMQCGDFPWTSALAVGICGVLEVL